MISTSSDRKSVYQSHNRLMPTPLATPSIEYRAIVTSPHIHDDSMGGIVTVAVRIPLPEVGLRVAARVRRPNSYHMTPRIPRTPVEPPGPPGVRRGRGEERRLLPGLAA